MNGELLFIYVDGPLDRQLTLVRVALPYDDDGTSVIPHEHYVDGVDAGVSNLVALLRLHRFDTTDSGDGVSKLASDPDALPYPHVFIIHRDAETLVAEAKRLLRVVTQWKSTKTFAEGQAIEANFSPVDGVCVLSVLGVSDKDLKPLRMGSDPWGG